MLVHRADMLDIECIVRGYLAGSAYKEYQREGTVHGMPMPAGLLPRPGAARAHLHPSTKATEGHDLNIGMAEAIDIVGREAAEAAAALCLEAYSRAAARAEEQGIVICDTKFELGYINGELSLCDEVLTPDSSRFWRPTTVRRVPTRPRSTSSPCGTGSRHSRGTSRRPAGLPQEIVDATSSRYVAAYERVCGRSLADCTVPDMADSRQFSVQVEVLLRDGIADPQGATIERALPALGLDGVTSVRAGSRSGSIWPRTTSPTRWPRPRWWRTACWPTGDRGVAGDGGARRSDRLMAPRVGSSSSRGPTASTTPSTPSSDSAAWRSWCGTPPPRYPPTTRSSCRAASPTATTCGRVPSPASPRSWTP